MSQEVTLSDHLKKYSINNAIIVIFANYKYKVKIDRRIKELVSHKLTNYMIIALDNRLYTHLSNLKKNTWYSPCAINRTADRPKLWIKRVNIIYEIVKLGYDILHMDGDACMRRNVFNKIDKDKADIFLARGTVLPYDILHKWGFVIWFGFFYCKSSKNTINFWLKMKEKVIKFQDDQVAMNHTLKESKIIWDLKEENVIRIPFRQFKLKCSNSDVIGRDQNGLTALVLPWKYFPRIKHDSNDPYLFDYL